MATKPFGVNDHRYPVLTYVDQAIGEAGVGGLTRVIDITKAPYNAVANDPSINNREAIQAALDSGGGQPILVFRPPGSAAIYEISRVSF